MTAAALRKLADDAERQESDETLAAVCKLVGVGVGAVQSRERTAVTAKKRAVVAWTLGARLGWKPALVAGALKRTEKQVRRLIKQEI